MIEFLFLDLDDTILDFQIAERTAIIKTFAAFGIDPTEEVLELYHHINLRYWQMLERGEKTREQVMVQRFETLFEQVGIQGDPEKCGRLYKENLGIGHFFLPGAEEAVKSLHKKYRLFIASNGTASVQAGRLESAKLYPWFEKIFISEELGHNKPAKEFFAGCFAQIPGFDPVKAMIVGDSLTSDILGGLNAGMLTCWVNPKGKQPKHGITPHYQIQALHQLEALLDPI